MASKKPVILFLSNNTNIYGTNGTYFAMGMPEAEHFRIVSIPLMCPSALIMDIILWHFMARVPVLRYLLIRPSCPAAKS